MATDTMKTKHVSKQSTVRCLWIENWNRGAEPQGSIYYKVIFYNTNVSYGNNYTSDR